MFLLCIPTNKPYIFSPDECVHNNDCPFDKACIANECGNPCLTTSCGTGAMCKIDNHSPVCYCPVGLQGNAILECKPVGCHNDDDCQTNEVCSRGSGKCRALCTGQPCARGAECSAYNHREHCQCIPPLQGDGFVYCTECKKTVENALTIKNVTGSYFTN